MIGGVEMHAKEFVKTSIHNHFGGRLADFCRGNKNENPSFDIELAKLKIDNAYLHNFELLGFTNHNYFWYDEFILLKNYINGMKYNITLIPGVEIDIKDEEYEDRFFHIVLLLSENNGLDKFNEELTKFTKVNNGYWITIAQLTELIHKKKCIIIPHGSKGTKRSAKRNVALFDQILDIRDFYPILLEETQVKNKKQLELKLKDKISNEKLEWIGNNVGIVTALDQDSDYANIKEPTYIWGDASFDSLFYCAIIGNDRVYREVDIEEKNVYISKIVLKKKSSDAMIQNSVIEFSHGLNSIIGNSGSGKTLLLNLVKKTISGENLKNTSSSTDANYDDVYKGLECIIYDNDDNVITDGDRKINIFEGENLYRQIVVSLSNDKKALLKDLDALPSFEECEKYVTEFNFNMNEYVKNQITYNNSVRTIYKSLIQINSSSEYIINNKVVDGSIEFIVDSKIITNLNQKKIKINEIKNDIIKLKENYILTKAIFEKYNRIEEIEILTNVYFSALKEMNIILIIHLKTKLREEVMYKMNEKLSALVTEYNKNISRRTDKVMESKKLVNKYSENILNDLKVMYNIEQKSYVPTLSDSILKSKIQSKEDIIKLDNFSINNEITQEDISVYFDTCIGKSQDRVLKSEFTKKDNLFPINLNNTDSVKKFLDVFIEKESNILGGFRFIPDKYIKYDIHIKNLDGEFKKIDSLSAGQLSKIYINLLIDKKLDVIKNNAIILYDQPDNNLEKKFILDILGKKLSELKKNYQVIITTHEPLLVVNADSNRIIRANNDPIAGVNNICYENVSLIKSNSVEFAIESVANLIDGSRESLKIRSQIYGGYDEEI